ncbi:MAG: type secretion protein family [Bryobacterales bacterium]|nr:type secretion protein family [Bryobacterales bacterium]
MREELLEHYERELAYLRELGGEFAQRYPRVASRLLLEPDRCEDPHVERLLEGFAFLAARIHLRIDDDFPELTSGLLSVIYPHYLRPIPAMTVVECQMEHVQGKATAAVAMPVGTVLTTKRRVDGLACRFRTCYPVELWPFSVAACEWRLPERLARPMRTAGAAATMQLRLECAPDVSFAELDISDLRFHLSGETNVVHTLYELLCNNCISIVVRNPEDPTGPDVHIAPDALVAMGFEEDEALLPYPRRSFDGYRLLQEYFTFSEKFLFFRLAGLQALRTAKCKRTAEVSFVFSRFARPERQQALEVGISARTVRLGCTPVINLYEQTAEPILLTQTQHEYRVIPDVRHDAVTEIFSVDDVLASNPSKRTVASLQPLFAFRSQTREGNKLVFWHGVRRPNILGERIPSAMYISIADIEGVVTDPDAEILTVRCTCTNHDLPSRLPFGADDGDFFAEAVPAASLIRALRRPTPSYDPPNGRGQLWRLISQLSLNYLSLEEDGRGALQEILRLHNFTGSSFLENQIGGITRLTAKPHVALTRSHFGITPARGPQVEIEFDERQFVGGGLFLFANVLERFLGCYTSMNSFCQLVAFSSQRKEAVREWLPRAGSKTLI